MKTLHPSGLLKAALLTDALASGAVGLLHLLLNRLLSERLGLDSRLLLATGLFLLACGNLLLVLAYADRIRVGLLRLIVAGNVVWAAGCVLTMFHQDPVRPPAALFLAMQAAVALIFAGWEYAGMRASSGMRPLAALRS